MITGTRLASMLAFQRDVVQDEIVKASGRLVEVDRKLNALRIEEALAWRRYANRTPTGADAMANEKVAAIFERRVEGARSAIDVISRADAEVAALEKRHSGAAAAVAEARAALETRSSEPLLDAAARESLERLERESAELKGHLARLLNWNVQAKHEIPIRLADIEGRKPFAYLSRRGFGTDAYRAGWPWKGLDGWLARTVGFDDLSGTHAALTEYFAQTAAWSKECETKLDDNLREISRVTEAAVSAALDSPRSQLAECVNRLSDVENAMDGHRIVRAEALMRLLDLALGRDRDYQTMVDTFIRLLSHEKAAAMVRLATPGEAVTPTGEIDLIVRDRLLLSMESDGLRRYLLGAESRIKAVEDVMSRLNLRKWNSTGATFEIDERTMLCHDLATGRTSAETAWQEIEGGLRRRQERPMALSA